MPTRTAITVICVVGLTALAVGPVTAQSYGMAKKAGTPGPELEHILKVDQRLGGAVPLDGVFYDHQSQRTSLRAMMGGKPTFVVPFYSSCPRLCNEVIIGLIEMLRAVRKNDPKMTAGEAFHLVMLSIDPREPPALASSKRAALLEKYDGRSPDAPGVWFVTAGHGQGTDVSEADRTIHDVTDSLGFPFVQKYRGTEYQYRPDPKDPKARQWLAKDDKPMPQRRSGRDTDEYLHPAAVVLLTGDGSISHYFLGVSFQPVSQVESAVRIAAGGGKSDNDGQRAPLCSTFEEVTDQYKPIMRGLAIASVPFVLLVFGIAIYSWRRSHRESFEPLPEYTDHMHSPSGHDPRAS